MKVLQGLIVGLLVGSMLTAGLFLWNGSCPDSPELVVEAVALDSAYHHGLYDCIMSGPSPCADSIAVLNDYIGWYTNLQMELSDDGCVKVYATPILIPDPCSGMVSIAAVDSFVYNDSMIDTHAYWLWRDERLKESSHE